MNQLLSLNQLMYKALASTRKKHLHAAIRQMAERFRTLPITERLPFFLQFRTSLEKQKKLLQGATGNCNGIEVCSAIAEVVVSWQNVEILKYFLGMRALDDEQHETADAYLCPGLWKFMGTNLAATFEVCRILLGYQTQRMESHFRQYGDIVDKKLDPLEDMPIKYLICTTLHPLVSGLDRLLNRKQWFIHLLHAHEEGDVRATEYLECIYSIIELETNMFQRPGAFLSEEMSQFADYSSNWKFRGRECYVIPEEVWEVWTDFLEKRKSKQDQLREKAWSLNSWLAEREEKVMQEMTRLSDDINARRVCWLRPFGFDSLVVNVSSLQILGLKSIAFYPEGETAPNTKIAVVLQKPGGFRVQLWATFRDFSLTCSEYVYFNWDNCQAETSRLALEFILLHALHRILVREENTDSEGHKVDRSYFHESAGPKKQVVVRPYIRRLPEGHRASQEARIQAFLALGQELPEGVTFVGCHERYTDLPEGKPAPLFTYTDEILMRSIS